MKLLLLLLLAALLSSCAKYYPSLDPYYHDEAHRPRASEGAGRYRPVYFGP